MSLNVSLPPELENRVRAHVASGMFGSASEVIREALRLFESYQSVQSATLANLKADIEQGQADKRAGRVGPRNIEGIKAEGRRQRSAKANG
jgi:antitoxin ParD1/3/4